MKPYLRDALAGYGSLFHFTVPPPANIEHRDNLASADSELVVACVLANFQKGRFDVADALVPLMAWLATDNSGHPRGLSRQRPGSLDDSWQAVLLRSPRSELRLVTLKPWKCWSCVKQGRHLRPRGT